MLVLDSAESLIFQVKSPAETLLIMPWRHMAMVIGAGDETLQFRNIFPSMKTPALVKDTGVWSLG
uniref:Uncharacterized protein n=1 Tax=Vitis vinifera TaxID=29760 RepID=F6H949_VITVI